MNRLAIVSIVWCVTVCGLSIGLGTAGRQLAASTGLDPALVARLESAVERLEEAQPLVQQSQTVNIGESAEEKRLRTIEIRKAENLAKAVAILKESGDN